MKKVLTVSTLITLTLLSSTAWANPYDLISKLQLQLEQQQEEIRQLRGETEALKHQMARLNGSAVTPTPLPATAETPKVAEPERPSFSSAPQVDASLAYTQAYDLLEARRFADAKIAFEDFLTHYPNNPLTMNAYYWLGEMDYMNGDYSNAALKFGDAYQAYRSQKSEGYSGEALNRAPEVMMKMAMAMSNIGKTEAAKLTLSELEKEFTMIPANISQQVSLLKRELARKTA